MNQTIPTNYCKYGISCDIKDSYHRILKHQNSNYRELICLRCLANRSEVNKISGKTKPIFPCITPHHWFSCRYYYKYGGQLCVFCANHLEHGCWQCDICKILRVIQLTKNELECIKCSYTDFPIDKDMTCTACKTKNSIYFNNHN